MQKQEFEEMVGQRVTTEFYNVVEKAYMAKEAECFLCGQDFVGGVFGIGARMAFGGTNADIWNKSLDIKLAEYLLAVWQARDIKNKVWHSIEEEEQARKRFRAYTKSLLHYDSDTADTVARLVA